jgi:hypothetical protein
LVLGKKCKTVLGQVAVSNMRLNNFCLFRLFI